MTKRQWLFLGGQWKLTAKQNIYEEINLYFIFDRTAKTCFTTNLNFK